MFISWPTQVMHMSEPEFHGSVKTSGNRKRAYFCSTSSLDFIQKVKRFQALERVCSSCRHPAPTPLSPFTNRHKEVTRQRHLSGKAEGLHHHRISQKKHNTSGRKQDATIQERTYLTPLTMGSMVLKVLSMAEKKRLWYIASAMELPHN